MRAHVRAHVCEHVCVHVQVCVRVRARVHAQARVFGGLGAGGGRLRRARQRGERGGEVVRVLGQRRVGQLRQNTGRRCGRGATTHVQMDRR